MLCFECRCCFFFACYFMGLVTDGNYFSLSNSIKTSSINYLKNQTTGKVLFLAAKQMLMKLFKISEKKIYTSILAWIRPAGLPSPFPSKSHNPRHHCSLLALLYDCL